MALQEENENENGKGSHLSQRKLVNLYANVNECLVLISGAEGKRLMNLRPSKRGGFEPVLHR